MQNDIMPGIIYHKEFMHLKPRAGFFIMFSLYYSVKIKDICILDLRSGSWHDGKAIGIMKDVYCLSAAIASHGVCVFRTQKQSARRRTKPHSGWPGTDARLTPQIRRGITSLYTLWRQTSGSTAEQDRSPIASFSSKIPNSTKIAGNSFPQTAKHDKRYLNKLNVNKALCGAKGCMYKNTKQNRDHKRRENASSRPLAEIQPRVDRICAFK